ncbi:MAG: AAA family ATPase [Candidatus Nealsonbacteria bacterium]|nr:AAA family ATPase [Candidatus Nealsonbacteria bacterium]
MYESYWQLKQKPFDNGADPRFYYPGESHQAALLKLRYAVENHRGGALLAGASGTGKTLVVGMIRQVLAEQFSPQVHLVFPQMPCAELLAYLADELEGTATAPPTPGLPVPSLQATIHRIQRLLAENTRQRRHAVVIVDEAHLLRDVETLEAMRLLLNFQSAGRPDLTLVLCGQPGILPTLQRTPQLDERLGVKCLLSPLSETETARYVHHRLQVAGAKREIIEPGAIPTLYALTHGIARQINRLCDLSLLIGFAEERQTITAAHFESVCQELVAVVPE